MLPNTELHPSSLNELAWAALAATAAVWDTAGRQRPCREHAHRVGLGEVAGDQFQFRSVFTGSQCGSGGLDHWDYGGTEPETTPRNSWQPWRKNLNHLLNKKYQIYSMKILNYK